MVTARIFPFKENSHGRAGNRTRNLMISSQRLWPLGHEAKSIANKIKYLVMSGDQNTRRSQIITIEIVPLKGWKGTTLSNKSYIQAEIKSRFK